MAKPTETFEHEGLTVQIYQDEDAFSPGEDEDENAFIVTTDNRYFVVRPDWCDTPKQAEQFKETHYIYPLYAYIHSGVALSLGNSAYPFNDRWDSGQIGFCLVTKDKSEIPHPEDYAQGMIEEWNQYLSGDVYGYVISNEEEDHIDSCWGFYGMEYAIEEARRAAEVEAEYRKEQAAKIDAMMHE